MEAKVGIEPTWTALQTVAFVSPLCHFATDRLWAWIVTGFVRLAPPRGVLSDYADPSAGAVPHHGPHPRLRKRGRRSFQRRRGGLWCKLGASRSEERRVGKECSSEGAQPEVAKE